MKSFKIAIDGPAASGKSTISKLLSKKLGWINIDTGIMFRMVTFYLIKKNINWNNIEQDKYLKFLLKDLKMEYQKENIYCNNIDLSSEIQQNRIKIDHKIAIVASLPLIREKILILQQKIINENLYLIMHGRDIGTIVMPKADLKIFLTANIEERIKRRTKEFQNINENKLNQIIKDMYSRDAKDTNRDIAPLKKAEDAILLDTTNMNIIEIIDHIHNLIYEKMVKK